MNNITFTASPMSKPVDMPLKASLAWDYFFDNGSWFCVETGDGGIIVTDESRELSNAFVLPDYVSLLEWLESYSSDRLAEDPAEYFRACGVVQDNLLSDSVVQALLATINAAESPVAPPVSAEEKPEPPVADSTPEQKVQDYYVTFAIDGRYTVKVEANCLDAAKENAQTFFEAEYFGPLEFVETELTIVEDDQGNIIYER